MMRWCQGLSHVRRSRPAANRVSHRESNPGPSTLTRRDRRQIVDQNRVTAKKTRQVRRPCAVRPPSALHPPQAERRIWRECGWKSAPKSPDSAGFCGRFARFQTPCPVDIIFFFFFLLFLLPSLSSLPFSPLSASPPHARNEPVPGPRPGRPSRPRSVPFSPSPDLLIIHDAAVVSVGILEPSSKSLILPFAYTYPNTHDNTSSAVAPTPSNLANHHHSPTDHRLHNEQPPASTPTVILGFLPNFALWPAILSPAAVVHSLGPGTDPG